MYSRQEKNDTSKYYSFLTESADFYFRDTLQYLQI